MISSYLLEEISKLQNEESDVLKEKEGQDDAVPDNATTHSLKQVVMGDATSLYYARKQCHQFGFCIGDKVGSNPHPRLAVHNTLDITASAFVKPQVSLSKRYRLVTFHKYDNQSC